MGISIGNHQSGMEKCSKKYEKSIEPCVSRTICRYSSSTFTFILYAHFCTSLHFSTYTVFLKLCRVPLNQSWLNGDLLFAWLSQSSWWVKPLLSSHTNFTLRSFWFSQIFKYFIFPLSISYVNTNVIYWLEKAKRKNVGGIWVVGTPLNRMQKGIWNFSCYIFCTCHKYEA